MYVGGWLDDKRHGAGASQSASGLDRYDGEWAADARHGVGISRERRAAGLGEEVYDGEWVRGIRHGKGTMSYANGDVYVGEWLNGKQNGQVPRPDPPYLPRPCRPAIHSGQVASSAPTHAPDPPTILARATVLFTLRTIMHMAKL